MLRLSSAPSDSSAKLLQHPTCSNKTAALTRVATSQIWNANNRDCELLTKSIAPVSVVVSKKMKFCLGLGSSGSIQALGFSYLFRASLIPDLKYGLRVLAGRSVTATPATTFS